VVACFKNLLVVKEGLHFECSLFVFIGVEVGRVFQVGHFVTSNR